MKNLAVFTAALVLSCSALSMTAFAEGSESVQVYVTISDKDGKLALIQEKINVTDTDGDGALTINDALYLAHEAEYDGGAAAGYATSNGTYGLSLSKLWGTENGGSYGYYVNNASAWSLTDVLNDGDYLNAFVYTDLTGWSDSYSWFDVNSADAEQGEEITLTLSRAGFDAEWNPLTLPVENAVISINGTDTEYRTDADGKVTVKLENAGQNVISASSESLILVPPVSVVTVAGETTSTTSTETSASTTETTVTSSETTTTSSASTASTSKSTATASSTSSAKTSATTTTTTTTGSSAPKTGDAGTGAAVLLLGSAAAAAFALKKKNEE